MEALESGSTKPFNMKDMDAAFADGLKRATLRMAASESGLSSVLWKILPFELILRPLGEEVICREGQAQFAFVILRSDGLDIAATRIAPAARGDDGAAAIAVTGNPLGDAPAIGQSGLLVRRTKVQDRLIVGIGTDAGVPIDPRCHTTRKQGRDQRQQKQSHLHAAILTCRSESANSCSRVMAKDHSCSMAR